MSNAGERRITRFPKWHHIDEWCDLPKEQRQQSMADWCGDQPSNGVFSLRGRPNVVDGEYINNHSSEPIASSCCHTPKVRRMVPVGACDYNIKRVEIALKTDTEIPPELQITTPDGYKPSDHFAKIIKWRQPAEQQDREQRERVEGYREHKALQQRVTLTTKGYRKAHELNREAKDGAQAQEGEHPACSKRARSVA